MADITDRHALEAWLADKPREVATLLAARSALRVLPLLRAQPDTAAGANAWLQVFRANAVSLITAIGPTDEMEVRKVAAPDAAYASRGAAVADFAAVAAASAAATARADFGFIAARAVAVRVAVRAAGAALS